MLKKYISIIAGLLFSAAYCGASVENNASSEQSQVVHQVPAGVVSVNVARNMSHLKILADRVKLSHQKAIDEPTKDNIIRYFDDFKKAMKYVADTTGETGVEFNHSSLLAMNIARDDGVAIGMTSVAYTPDASRISELTATIGKKDYFADYMEMQSKQMLELAKKLRKIRGSHLKEISKGYYDDYLFSLSSFLGGMKIYHPNAIDESLIKVNMMRQYISAVKRAGDNKIPSSPCANCLNKKPFYINGKLVKEVNGVNHAAE